MTHEIKADWDTLLNQSKLTGEDYFIASHRVLQNSGLKFTTADVIALARIMADDFRSTGIAVSAQKIEDCFCSVSGGIEGISEAIWEKGGI
jgi:hypothetical protein